MNESIKYILSEDIINEIEDAEKRNDGNEETHWTLYVHVVPKEITSFKIDRYYVGITERLPHVRWGEQGCRYQHQPFGKAVKIWLG